MSATLTENFRYLNIKNFISSLQPDSNENKLYLFVSRVKEWDEENSPPEPVRDYSYYSDIYRNIVGLKLLTSSNVCPVIKRVNWTTGTVYTMYRPDYTTGNTEIIGSGNTSLRYPPKITVNNQTDIFYDSNFYVINDNYQVYKCLNNGAYENTFGLPSTVQPTGTSVYPIRTSDGYTWKYMFTIPTTYILNFANSEYIPVPYPGSGFSEDLGVKNNSISGSGAIEAVIVKNGGEGYTDGTYTLNILGDGSGATVLLTILGGKIINASIVNRGSNYTFGKIHISSNLGSGTGAEFEVIVSPKYGHGYSPWKELGARRIMINSSITPQDTSIPQNIGYRQIGLLLNPIQSGTTSIATGSSLSGVNSITFTSATFQANQISGKAISQSQGSGVTANGVAVSWDNASKILKYYQDRFDGIGSGNTIVPFKTGISVTSDYGTGTGATNITNPDIELNSGEILYLDNREVVNRSLNQTEDIKIVVEF